MQGQKAGILLGTFHALGNDALSQTLAHTYHGIDDTDVVGVAAHLVDKRFVDFQCVNRKLL